jgi:hypothetical protein
MIRHTDQKSVSQILPNDKEIMYKIPKYQRKYTWGQNEWDLLFNDIIDNEEGYFLGSTISVAMPTSAYDPVALEIIDGQQRMTSLSILLTVLYSKLAEHKDELDDDERTDLNNIKRQLAFKFDNKYIPRLCLQIQDNNQDDYNSLLYNAGIIDEGKTPLNAGNRRIYKAYRHFEKLVNNFLQSDDYENEYISLKADNKVKTLLNLVKRFNSAVLVVIEVDNHKDAYMLFESLNNRGVPLTAIDLIKNLLISTSEKDGKSEECYNRWRKIQDNLGEEYSVQERFFRQYYNAFIEKLNAPFVTPESTKKYPLAYLATKTTLMDIYEKLIRRNYAEFLDKIEKASDKYATIINNSDTTCSYSSELENLERIQGAPAYLLLLYLEENKESLNITDGEMKRIIILLTSFFVRRNLTDVPNTRTLTKLFMDIINSIKENNGSSIYGLTRNELLKVSASDELFEERLRGPIYDTNDMAARFVLCYMESLHQTKEIYTDLWSRDNSNKYVWTIEHVFPEGPKIPEEWVKMIADGDEKIAYDYYDKYVHTLGNLTITGYNSNLSNFDFNKKKYRENQEGKEVGYTNGLYLNSDIVTEDSWSGKKITDRTDKLVKILLDLFKM